MLCGKMCKRKNSTFEITHKKKPPKLSPPIYKVPPPPPKNNKLAPQRIEEPRFHGKSLDLIPERSVKCPDKVLHSDRTPPNCDWFELKLRTGKKILL